MQNGTLEDVCKNSPKGWNATKKSINIFGIAVGMAYIHSQKIIHRDLKPGNIFLNEKFEPCIADFGVSRVDAIKMTALTGTPLFMAPELYSDDDCELYANKVGVYSYAILLYKMFTDNAVFDDNPRPVKNQKQLMDRVGAGARFLRDSAIPDGIWDLITECCQRNPDLRPSFAQIVKQLRDKVEYWALEGTDMRELREYQERILRGVCLEEKSEEEDFADSLMQDIMTEDENESARRMMLGYGAVRRK